MDILCKKALDKADNYDGVGFVFTESDPFIGIDIDHCRKEDGSLTEYARDMIHRCGSYAEVSPSGTGIHIIGLGRINIDGSGKRTDKVEMYQKLRFFTITGNNVEGFTRIHDVQDVVDEVLKEIAKGRKPETKVDNAQLDFEALPASEDDFTFLQKLYSYKNGNVLKSLFEGENVLYGGDASRNDLYFCTYINWANGNDLKMTDRIFRSSGRMGCVPNGTESIIAMAGRMGRILSPRPLAIIRGKDGNNLLHFVTIYHNL